MQTTFIHGSNTSDARLVASLIAMGIPMMDAQQEVGSLAVEKSSSRPDGSRVWVIGAQSDCGNWQADQLCAWWRDRDWHWRNFNHPFAKVRIAMGLHKAFVSWIRKGTALRKSRKCGAWLFEEADEREPLMREGFAPTRVRSNPIDLAILSLCGFESWPTPPVGDTVCRYFSVETSQNYTFQQVDHILRSHDFIKSNPQHELSYAKAALINYRPVVDAIKRDKPLVEIRKGDSVARLHPDCSAETERKILSQFDK